MLTTPGIGLPEGASNDLVPAVGPLLLVGDEAKWYIGEFLLGDEPTHWVKGRSHTATLWDPDPGAFKCDEASVARGL